VSAQLKYRENIGMVEGGGGARLLLEAPQAVGTLRQQRRQHLDCDLTPQVRIPRPVHPSHAART
jgi:hypothetical protein